MLELDDTLPPGALMDGAREDFRGRLAGANCLWLEGRPEQFRIDPETGAVAAWSPARGGTPAVPVEPNTANATLVEAGDMGGLRCVAGTNCGLVAGKVTENAARFSMAVIYLPPEEGEARTLLTLNTGYSGSNERNSNYLFLSDGGDAFTIKDTKGAIELVAPVTSAQNAPRLATVTLSGGTLAFQENRGPVHKVVAADPGMHAGADLFIGCRSHRKGLQKTLGGAVILEVLFWPDHTLLAPRGPEDTAQYDALQSYFLWEY